MNAWWYEDKQWLRAGAEDSEGDSEGDGGRASTGPRDEMFIKCLTYLACDEQWHHQGALSDPPSWRSTCSRLRLDSVPDPPCTGWNTRIGVVCGPTPVTSTAAVGVVFTSNFEGGAFRIPRKYMQRTPMGPRKSNSVSLKGTHNSLQNACTRSANSTV